MFTHRIARAAFIAGLVLTMAVLSSGQAASSIAVSGDVKQPLTLTAADLAGLPRATVTTNNNGIARVYEGVWLSEVLKKAGVQIGGLRGPTLAVYVVASASDGYQVVFSSGELDPEMTDAQFLLADKADGKPLFGEDGAFRLVVPKDKRGARSVRMLNKLEVFQVKK